MRLTAALLYSGQSRAATGLLSHVSIKVSNDRKKVTRFVISHFFVKDVSRYCNKVDKLATMYFSQPCLPFHSSPHLAMPLKFLTQIFHEYLVNFFFFNSYHFSGINPHQCMWETGFLFENIKKKSKLKLFNHLFNHSILRVQIKLRLKTIYFNSQKAYNINQTYPLTYSKLCAID